MYNFTPYGQPGQPVRPSYNMLFSHFKQLGVPNPSFFAGYSDELAGAEANRIMIQTNAYSQYAAAQPQAVQANRNVYQGVATAAPTNPAAAYSQVVQQPVAQPQPPATTNYDKSNLLSGVKLASRPSSVQIPNFPATSSADTQSKGIKINLKQTPVSSSPAKPFQAPPVQQPAPMAYAVAQQPMGYAMPQPVGYAMNPQVAAYMYAQPGVQAALAQMQYQSAYSPPAPKNNNLSSVFYIDTKGKSGNKKSQTQPKGPVTIDEVNKWIQDLYIHLNMTTCSKKLRKAVNVYIQHILDKFRAKTLLRTDLRMLSQEEIMEFKPDSPEAKPDPKVEPKVEKTEKINKFDKAEKMEKLDRVPKLSKEVVSDESKRTLQTLKGKKKLAKSKKSEESPYRAKVEYAAKGVDTSEIHRREQRSQRFKMAQPTPVYNFSLVKNKTIVGLSQELEKPYLRLTSEPNPLIVRPENVLVKSFRHVFDKFIASRNYVYVQEQFRSIRQDIQVQHLRTPFVVRVYTTNARLALLHNDLDQFNQCQTQLKHLLKCFHNYQALKVEFELYYILYLSLQNMNMDLLRYLKENYVASTSGRAGAGEEGHFRNTSYFNFANAVRLSISDENFTQYFKLASTSGIDYELYLKTIYDHAFAPEQEDVAPATARVDSDTPFYCKLLFRMFEDKFRMFSLYTLCRSSLTLSTPVLVELLNFKDEAECLKYLREHHAVFNDSGLIDCKQTLGVIVESPLMRSKKI